MEVKETRKPLLLRLLLRVPYLLKLAKLINLKVLDKAGLRIVDLDALMVATGMIDRTWKRRLLYFERLLSRVEDVEGDIVECGVWKGESLTSLIFLNRNSIKKRRI